MFQIPRLTLPLVLIAGAALAHQGVKDPDVKKRMDLMGGIGAQMGVLVDMAKEKTEFDATDANAAKEKLATLATAIPDAFRKPATDPKSEARPAIWEDFADFTAKSDAMAAALATVDASDLAGVRAAVPLIGQTCGACHQAYKTR